MTDFSIPNTFIPGTKARAEEVNENFTACKNAINEKASKEGNSLQTFNVATASEDTHAVNKSQFDDIKNNLESIANANSTNFCVRSGNINELGEEDLITYLENTISFKVGSGENESYSPIKAVTVDGRSFEMEAIPDFEIIPKSYSGLIPIMNANTMSGYTVSLTNEAPAAPAWKAFNQSDADMACSDGAVSANIVDLKVQLPIAKKIDYYTLTAFYSGTATGHPIEWDLDASTNGTTWVTLDSQNSIYWYDKKTLSFKVDSKENYLYYRLRMYSFKNEAMSSGNLFLAGFNIYQEDENGSYYFDETHNIYIKPNEDNALIFNNRHSISQTLPKYPIINDVCLLSSSFPLKAKYYNGTDWEDFNGVKVGEAYISEGSVYKIKTNKFNENGCLLNSSTTNLSKRCWISPSYPILYSSTVTATHNLNLEEPEKAFGEVFAFCESADSGYEAGDNACAFLTFRTYADGSKYHFKNTVNIKRNTVSTVIGEGFSILTTSGQLIQTADITKWRYIIKIWY